MNFIKYFILAFSLISISANAEIVEKERVVGGTIKKTIQYTNKDVPVANTVWKAEEYPYEHRLDNTNFANAEFHFNEFDGLVIKYESVNGEQASPHDLKLVRFVKMDIKGEQKYMFRGGEGFLIVLDIIDKSEDEQFFEVVVKKGRKFELYKRVKVKKLNS